MYFNQVKVFYPFGLYIFIYFFTGEQHLKIRIIALGENILGKQQTIIFLNKSHFVFDSKNK